MGDESGSAIFALRFLVASGVRHIVNQRMGHAEYDRKWPTARPSPQRQIRTSNARLGPAPAAPCADTRFGQAHQMVLEMRPAHNPTKAYGFVGVVVSLKDLSASIWLWHRDNGAWSTRKVIEVPAEPAEPEKLPPALKPFKAVPPLVTDINLSLDDRFLYISCWGTG